ncbi:MAG: hypothetical protein HZB82_03520 [Deltaproteobacteria bacterium]|nr:hypothetical protein [Deltaproteobacteria bacterium]
MDVYLIMGAAKTRKSATIRCLTGLGSRQVCDIQLLQGNKIDIFTHIRALQEQGIAPDKFIADIKKESHTNLLIPLRIKKANRCPDGDEYIMKFQKTGWNIMPIFVLGTQSNASLSALNLNIQFIATSAQNPNNHNANIVKKTWGWA